MTNFDEPMSYVIRLIQCESAAGPTPLDGQWLVDYDPDREGVGPNGEHMLAYLVCTPDRAKAKRFANKIDAMWTVRRQSSKWPLRPDGGVNRPLTAYSVLVEQL